MILVISLTSDLYISEKSIYKRIDNVEADSIQEAFITVKSLENYHGKRVYIIMITIIFGRRANC